MSPFRLVAGDQAGPSALGILVPPGRRTLVIVRPRPLQWDLLPADPEAANGNGLRFWEISREFAPRVAAELLHVLQQGSDSRGNRVEAIAAPDGLGYQVRASVGRFVLIVCERSPGRPYEPLIFATVAAACAAAERLGAFLCPAADAGQEVYLNMRHFSR